MRNGLSVVILVPAGAAKKQYYQVGLKFTLGASSLALLGVPAMKEHRVSNCLLFLLVVYEVNPRTRRSCKQPVWALSDYNYLRVT